MELFRLIFKTVDQSRPQIGAGNFKFPFKNLKIEKCYDLEIRSNGRYWYADDIQNLSSATCLVDILQTRMQIWIIMTCWLGKFFWNLFLMADLSKKSDKMRKNCWLVCKIHKDPNPELKNYFWLENFTSDRYWPSDGSVQNLVGILQIGQYCTQNAHFLFNCWSDFTKILTASLYHQYLTLVKISSL